MFIHEAICVIALAAVAAATSPSVGSLPTNILATGRCSGATGDLDYRRCSTCPCPWPLTQRLPVMFWHRFLHGTFACLSANLFMRLLVFSLVLGVGKLVVCIGGGFK